MNKKSIISEYLIIEKKGSLMESTKGKSINLNYGLLDLLKFVCAYMVIGIHTRPFLESNAILDQLLYYDIFNYAVPFFYACTGYFLITKQPQEHLHTKLVRRCRKTLTVYLKWSAIYLPLTIMGWIIEGKRSPVYLLKCLLNFLFVGENFYSWTLWYLNGLIFALILIDILVKKKQSIKKIFYIGVFMYVIGIELTMMNNHLERLPLFLAKSSALYFTFFRTTRNGLFQSLIFVTVGMIIAQINSTDEWKPSVKSGALVGFIYVVKVSLSLIENGQEISMVLDLPTFYFLFESIIFACRKLNFQGSFYKQLRGMSETIYFIHMYLVAFCALILYKDNYHNFKSFFICAGGATIIAMIYQIYINIWNKRQQGLKGSDPIKKSLRS